MGSNMDSSKGKKLIYVSEDILQKMESASKKEGMSVGRFLQEALNGIVKANELGYTPGKLYDVLQVLQTRKNFGEVIVPRAIFVEFMDLVADDQEREKLLEQWYECGRWHGTYINRTFDDPLALFKLFLESMGWDLNEVEIKEEKGNIVLMCISGTISSKETEMLSKFIEGALNGMDHSIEKKDIMAGMIILECANKQLIVSC